MSVGSKDDSQGHEAGGWETGGLTDRTGESGGGAQWRLEMWGAMLSSLYTS